MNHADGVRVARILAALEEGDRAWFLDRISEPWRRRARRLEERDARIREYALAFHPLRSGRAMASAIAIELRRYRVSGFRFEADLAAPAEARRGLLWRILHLNNRKSPSPGAVRAALAGVLVVGQKKPRLLATATGRRPRLGLKSGTPRDVGDSEGSETADHRQR